MLLKGPFIGHAQIQLMNYFEMNNFKKLFPNASKIKWAYSLFHRHYYLLFFEVIHWKGYDVRPNTVKGHSITEQDDLLHCYAKDILLNPLATLLQSVRSVGGNDSWEIRAWSLLLGSVCTVHVFVFTMTTVWYLGLMLYVSLQGFWSL